jgi:hypothetical protein
MEKIGMLTIMAESIENGRRYCTCRCDCGTIKKIRKDHIGINMTVSCGCYSRAQNKKAKTKHGMIHTRLYNIWLDMKQRCSNEKNTAYIYYGAKGVKVCEEWKSDFLNFYHWAHNNGYGDTLTIDRIDSNGNYFPDNCRWISQSENTTIAHLGKKYIRRSKTYGKRS